MKLNFFKYQGAGNDFIIVDNREQFFSKNNTNLVKDLCDRRFGIGADGLILLEADFQTDFKMVYYNSDGNEGSMCGNGARCITAFAQFLGIINNKAIFSAIDGLHEAFFENEKISIKMKNVSDLRKIDENTAVLDTGSPHYVCFKNNIDFLNIKKEGSLIRYSPEFKDSGINVNFVEEKEAGTFKVRTYERGVEDETLSCGTGVTAVAIAAKFLLKSSLENIHLNTLGGDLQVSFSGSGNHFENIWLTGPAVQVFQGEISVPHE